MLNKASQNDNPIAAVIQLNSQDQIDENLRRIEHWLIAAKNQGATLALLPENCIYMPKVQGASKAIAEPLGQGSIQSALSDLARTYELWLVVGAMPIIDESLHTQSTNGASNESQKVFQTTLVYNQQGQLVAHYHKRHLFDVTLPNQSESYRESDAFLQGDAMACVETPLGKLGLSICYDLRFPEHYRQLSEQGCQLFCVPAAFTYATGKAHWETLLRARAIENQCYVLASAQTGWHPSGRQTWGHSMLIDPWGEVLAELPEKEGVVTAAIDLSVLDNIRTQFPALSHRR